MSPRGQTGQIVNDTDSFPTTRAIIRELILEDNISIASGGNGYFVIETEDELKEYNSLESRMMSIVDRKYRICRALLYWKISTGESIRELRFSNEGVRTVYRFRQLSSHQVDPCGHYLQARNLR
jgi:hypothetical protein